MALKARGNHALLLLVLLLVLLVSCFSVCLCAENVTVTIRGATSIAKTDDSFICATLDWWPEEKCDYGQCPWGKAGLLNLDLKNEILYKAISAFKHENSSMRIRLGGSLQDQLLYNVGNAIKSCPQFKKQSDGIFGFSQGCLEMDRWDQIYQLMSDSGALVTFSLNILFGKTRLVGDSHDTIVGSWNPQNAQDFMKYTLSKGYKIHSYELGNELCGEGVSGRIDPVQYAQDIQTLKQLVVKLYPDSKHRPKVLGPAGFYEDQWFKTFLHRSGPNVVDGLSHHIYNLGAGLDKNLINKIQDPYFLDQVAETYRKISETVQRFGPWTGAWVGEAGGAFNSGGKDVSHTFVNGYWYLDQLGMTSTFDHKVYCRQTLIGGNYGLLNTTTYMPNPDYYGALLWNRVMGKKVLSVTHNQSPYLRTYAHCSKTKPGVTLLFINMDKKSTFNVSLTNDFNLIPGPGDVLTGFKGRQAREEYHLTPLDGNIQSDVVLLNGTPLKPDSRTFDIPEMTPLLVNATEPLVIAPQSIVFVTIKDFQAPACTFD